ncbi:MAG: methylated-DNA--[protein]-cysteine S-methyltransferase [Candidatus Melainabacteria bacterium]|nr:MAG: methylated-DNA--[protein]-cysteine S-methyltransferase [Candidatus Melainabacteria bacterium]
MTVFYCTTDSPIGLLTLTSDGESLTGLFMENHKGFPNCDDDWIYDEAAAPLLQTKSELADYFAGNLKRFTVPIKLTGTNFQMKVWSELQNISFGEVISYAELAGRIGNPNACRAVGLANGQNPISIIVPCHRVIGANGKLTGYGGGLPRKEVLLNLEQPGSLRKTLTVDGAKQLTIV